MKRSLPARLLGAATIAYAVSTMVKPGILARPTGMAAPDGSVAPSTRILISSIGARDAASGLALVLAPAGVPLSVAGAVRAASDLGDALFFGTMLTDRPARAKTVAVSVTWGLACATAGWWQHHHR